MVCIYFCKADCFLKLGAGTRILEHRKGAPPKFKPHKDRWSLR